MQKLITLIALAMSIVTASARTLYLVSGVWDTDGAKFAMYYFNMDETFGWSEYMTQEGDAYVGEIPDNYQWVIFVRLNPTGGINWESKWNQTEDLPIILDCYTILDWGEESQPSPGEWSSVYIDKIQVGDLYYNINKTTNTAEVTSESFSWPYWSSIIYRADIPSEVTSYYDDKTYRVTSIGEDAFFECKYLSVVSVPSSVTKISGEAFLRCHGLEAINVAADNPNFSSIEGVLFDKGKSVLYLYPHGKQGAYSIPDGVKYIGGRSFEDCIVTSVTIPKSVISIGNYAFYDSYAIQSVTNYATEPQPIKDQVFNFLDESPRTLYVPKESVGAYKAADNWKKFDSILPIGSQNIANNFVKSMRTTKILRDSQILILRGEKVYTLTGQEVK